MHQHSRSFVIKSICKQESVEYQHRLRGVRYVDGEALSTIDGSNICSLSDNEPIHNCRWAAGQRYWLTSSGPVYFQVEGSWASVRSRTILR